jgi:putative thiamine transport system ATP-binding protein
MSLVINLQSLSIGLAPSLLPPLLLTIAPGNIHTLMGPSGCGKSSLLNAIAGSLDPVFRFSGRIELNAKQIDQLPMQQRRVGLLFQDDLLFAHMTVAENCLFAAPPGPRSQRTDAVAQALTEMDLAEFAAANPQTLSGGQRARVSLARALLAQPQALLLDEPYAKLDSALRVRMRQLVAAQALRRQIPILLVTHDPADIADQNQVTLL